MYIYIHSILIFNTHSVTFSLACSNTSPLFCKCCCSCCRCLFSILSNMMVSQSHAQAWGDRCKRKERAWIIHSHFVRRWSNTCIAWICRHFFLHRCTGCCTLFIASIPSITIETTCTDMESKVLFPREFLLAVLTLMFLLPMNFSSVPLQVMC